MHLDVTILRMSNLVGPDPCYPLRVKIDFVHELMATAVDDGLIELRSKSVNVVGVVDRLLALRNSVVPAAIPASALALKP